MDSASATRPAPASSALVPFRAAAGLTLVGSTAAGWSDQIVAGLHELLEAPTVLGAIHAGERLRRAVARTPHRAPPVVAWPDPLGADLDAPSAYGVLHALAESPDPAVDDIIARAMTHDDPGLREHAIWAAARRQPIHASLTTLIERVGDGGFASMLAGLTLETWADRARGTLGSAIAARLHRAAMCAPTDATRIRLTDLAAVIASPVTTVESARSVHTPDARRRLRIVQPLLHGHLDRDLQDAGAGDGGGLVTLVVTLAQSLGRHPSVDDVLTIARRRSSDGSGTEVLGDGASLERIAFGGDEPLSIGSAWEYWPTVERQLARVLQANGRVDAIHLRLGDVGTLAASRIATRMGIPIVFTLAPDPHSVIAAEERAGTLDRDTFTDFDQTQHAWFRARLVTSLVAVADELVAFPRPGGTAELAQLLGVPLPFTRVSVVAEGIDLEESRVARVVAVDGPRPRVIGRLAERLAAGPAERIGLPLIVSAARLHPVKGLDRLVAAWLQEPELREAYNLVIVGGSLQDGTPEERRTLAAIAAVVSGAGIVGDVPGLLLMGSVSHSDVANLLAAAAVGSAPQVAPRGIYVCSSAKEEFGLSIVEALAAGLPVVAPNQGGPRTYIADGVTGVLTDTTSVAALGVAMLRATHLWRDPKRGSVAAEQLTSMGIDTMASRLVDVYRGSATAQRAVG